MDEQREDENSHECFVFCRKHYDIGRKELKLGGKDRIIVTVQDNQRILDQKQSTGKKGRDRLRKNDDNFDPDDNESEEDEQDMDDLADEANDDKMVRKHRKP
jgi:hypothetical protein